MAKVSLRVYNREIEGMIDQGRTDEAIAHCHHILKSFPKHLETYRLLGKSYLESKRYSEAVDIFGRVLMSVPDDFVAHVGMSIIRDEENKLDDSIWHMERAFEAKSANAAIQGELQRLYGRRDGMEPPKIRMTRGALAHMYVQGELYPQAIAEIRAVLAQDPQRGDMQVLLALSYFKGGQKSDAADMCAQLLKRYPYSIDANRIMVELLPATAGATEDTQLYRTRVGELDPYAAFATGSVFQSNEVPDAAINLEKFEYTGTDVAMGQEWGSRLGIGLGASSAPALTAPAGEQPGWLKSGGFTDMPSEASSETPGPFQSSNEIPDFLRDAGWGESTGPEQPHSVFDEVPSGGDLAPAEIPDWLKGQMPAAASPMEQPSATSGQSIDTPDWLRGLNDEPSSGAVETFQSETAAAGDTPDWLSGLGGSQVSSESAQPAEVPDWLSGLGDHSQPAAPEPSNDAPDWLKGLGGSQVASEPAQSADVPDWLRGLEEPAAPAASAAVVSAPDWLSAAESSTNTSAAGGSANAPDWLRGLDGGEQPAKPASPSVQDLGATAQEQDDAVAWLESLAAKHGAKPEELVTDPSKRFETPPEWVSQAQNLNQPAAVPQSPPATINNLGSTAAEQDDAVAWLESLATKHGAKPEELVTDPSKRFDTPPEWVSQAQNLNQQEPAPQAPAASVESLGSTEQEQDEAVAWLESLAAKHGAKPEELVTDPSKRFDTPPEWVSQAQSIGEAQSAAAAMEPEKPEAVENALNIGEQYFADFESGTTAASEPANDETGMWLRNLEKQEHAEELSSTKSNELPDWLASVQPPAAETPPQNAQGGDRPGWLSSVEPPAESMAPKPAAQNNDLPDWLSGIREESVNQNKFNEPNLASSDLTNWLSSLDDEPGLPFDALPTPDSILAAKTAEEVAANKSKAEKDTQSGTDLPDWLTSADSRNADMAEDMWKSDIQQETASAAPERMDEPTPAVQGDELPNWLQGLPEKVEDDEQIGEADESAPWLQREKWEAESVPHTKPTSPSDWHPIGADVKQKQPADQQRASTGPLGAEKEKDMAEILGSIPEPAPLKKKPSVTVRPRSAEAAVGNSVLNQAKGELDRGDIPTALDHYGKLIKKGKQLEETIRDLTESLYRYPVEVGIWQTLGDAYMRANRLKEALESYNKAEQLIR